MPLTLFALPMPVTTSPPIIHQIVIDKSVNNICMPGVHIRFNNMRYDLFLENVATKKVKSICMANNQKEADINMQDGGYNKIFFPEHYDVVSYILQYDIPIEFREISEKPSVIDIISLMIQVAIVRIVTQLFSSSYSASSNTFEEFMVKLLNSDLHNSIQYLYNFGKTLTHEDIKELIRKINCKIYISKRNVRKLKRKTNQQVLE